MDLAAGPLALTPASIINATEPEDDQVSSTWSFFGL
jgi:hypothetical protein